MDETIEEAFEKVVTSKEREEVVFVSLAKALAQIEDKYGPKGLEPRKYHNGEHTREVLRAAWLLGNKARAQDKINDQELQLLLIGAVFHDFVHEVGAPNNEENSAAAAAEAMSEAGVFSEQEIETVKDMIAGTKVSRTPEGAIKQSADGRGLLAQFLADADLWKFGGASPESFWASSVQYFEETEGRSATTDDLPNLRQQLVVMLDMHDYYTDEARQLFASKEVLKQHILKAPANILLAV